MNKSEYVTHTQLANEVKRLESIIETLRERNRMLYKKLQNAIDNRKYYFASTKPKRQDLTIRRAAALVAKELRKEGTNVPIPPKAKDRAKHAAAGKGSRPHIDWPNLDLTSGRDPERQSRAPVGCRPKE